MQGITLHDGATALWSHDSKPVVNGDRSVRTLTTALLVTEPSGHGAFINVVPYIKN
jgi:hypothetical protein